MEKPILHIPSVISQSCFTDTDGEVVDIKEKELNYFYLLLFLYRDGLLKDTPNILLKNEKRYSFNEYIKYDSVEIELIQFQNYGLISNYTYRGLKSFLEKLSQMSINTNLFRKNRDKDIETVRMIDSYSIDSTLININFTKKFLKEIIHTDKFFMNVDLNYLFNLNGYKSKVLYLILKDYSKVGNKNFKKSELELVITKIPQTNVLQKIITQINDTTDIKISYTTEGIKKKIYKFKIRNNVNLKSTPKKKKEEINTEIMEKSKKKIQQLKSKGKKFDNEEGYLKTVYNNELEKSKSQPKKQKSENELKIEEWIQIEISKLKQTEDIQYQYNNYLMLSYSNNGKEDELFLSDDYKLYSRIDFGRKNPITNSSEDTNTFLDNYNNTLTPKVFCGYGNDLKDKTLTKIRRD